MIPVMTECNVPAVFASKRSTNDFLIAWVDKAAPKLAELFARSFKQFLFGAKFLPIQCRKTSHEIKRPAVPGTESTFPLFCSLWVSQGLPEQNNILL